MINETYIHGNNNAITHLVHKHFPALSTYKESIVQRLLDKNFDGPEIHDFMVRHKLTDLRIGPMCMNQYAMHCYKVLWAHIEIDKTKPIN